MPWRRIVNSSGQREDSLLENEMPVRFIDDGSFAGYFGGGSSYECPECVDRNGRTTIVGHTIYVVPLTTRVATAQHRVCGLRFEFDDGRQEPTCRHVCYPYCICAR